MGKYICFWLCNVYWIECS